MGTDELSSNYETIDAESLIEAFGGIRPMAQKLDIAVSTIQGWKARNHIPPARMEEVLAAARSEGIDVSALTATVTIEGEAIILNDRSTESPQPAMKNEQEKTTAKTEKTPSPIDDEETSQSDVEEIRGGSTIAWLALILAIVVGAGLLSRPVWGPKIDSKIANYLESSMPSIAHNVNDDMNAEHLLVVERIAMLEKTLAELSSRPVADGATDVIDVLDNRLIALEQSIETIQSAAGNEGPADLSGVSEKLAALEAAQSTLRASNGVDVSVVEGLSQNISQVQNLVNELTSKLQNVELQMNTALKAVSANTPGQQASALVVSVSQLESDALSGKPYAAALDSVMALSDNHENILANVEILKPYVDNGIATWLELDRRFSAIAPDAEASYRKANAQDWVDETLENIRGLVSIRRIGEDPDLPPVSRAEAALERGDLGTAIQAMGEISNNNAVSNWLVDAQARLSVETALLDLRATAIDLLVNAGTKGEVSQ